MNVALDSDVIIRDPWFNLPDMQALLNYVEKTPWSLVITEVVEAEVFARVRRDIRKSLQQARSALRQARRYGAAGLPEVDIEAIVESTLHRLRERWDTMLPPGCIHREPLGAEDASEAAHRAAERIAPCRGGKGEKDPGMRDALIWLSLLRISRPGGSKMGLAFISNNINDYTQDGASLREELVKDVRGSDAHLVYYSSLEDFLREHSVDGYHITRVWVEERIDFEEIEEEIMFSVFPAHFTDEPTIHFRIRDAEMRALYQIDDLVRIDSIRAELSDFYVWRFEVDEVELRITLDAHVEATAECSLRWHASGSGIRPTDDAFRIGDSSPVPAERHLACESAVRMKARAFLNDGRLGNLRYYETRSV